MLYRVVVKIVRGIMMLLFKIEIEGIENIPKDKNFIVTPNHLSNFDPPLLFAYLPLEMGYLAKETLFKVPVVGSVIKAFGAFPVKRGGRDISAIKTAIEVLKSGKSLVIFPEGKRVRTQGVLGEGKQGAAMIALKAKVGLLPIGIETRYRFRGKVKIHIGEYIDLSEFFDKKASSQDLKKITDEVLMPEISQLTGAKLYGN